MTRPAFALFFLAFVAACDAPKASPSPAATTAVPAPSALPSAMTSTLPAVTATPPKPPPDAVAAQHVLVAYKGAKDAPKTVTRSKADAKARAEDVRSKAVATGADFSALVAEYSDDPGSKERQGSVGKFKREKMTKPFSDAAFALQVDEISPVVETDFGFHVIKRNQ